MFYIVVVFSFILYPSLCSISSFIKSLHFMQFVIHIIVCGFVLQTSGEASSVPVTSAMPADVSTAGSTTGATSSSSSQPLPPPGTAGHLLFLTICCYSALHKTYICYIYCVSTSLFTWLLKKITRQKINQF